MSGWLAQIVVAAISGGVVVALIAWGRERWRSRQPHAIEAASLAVVATARDELAEDNERLRITIAEMRSQHDEDRTRWKAERASLIAEVDSLYAQVSDLRKRVHATDTT